jgi:hypothetical protein
MQESLIQQRLAQLPASLQQEVLDFMEFLLHKYEGPRKRPVFGSAKGKYQLSADFDAPLEDFKDYMK